METKKKFGLFTSVCMIVGIVIGSGIFFKSDNVLIYTGGSIGLGVAVFAIAAFAIVFGSLTLAELAMRTDNTGGIIAYAEEFVGLRTACVFGWVQNFVYYPTITAVVSWVVGIYGCILFGIDASLELQIIIGCCAYSLLYLLNYLSAKLAGYFQNIATIMKLLPLALVAIAGMLFGNPDFSVLSGQAVTTDNLGWITAIGPIAFAYDGWIVATSISHEIKDARKNLPRALVMAPVFILVVYVCYFVGISKLIGAEAIIQMGDAHVDAAFNTLLGPIGSKISLIFVLISIMATSNGLILGSSRGIYALGVKDMIPGSRQIAAIDQRFDVPRNGLICSFILISIWTGIHYITTKFNLLPNSDVSEISIVTMYLLYIVLYLQVIKLKKSGSITSIRRGYINPILAILGSLIIFFGGIQNAMFLAYVGFSAVVILIAYWYSKKFR